MCYERAGVWPFAMGGLGNDRETPSAPTIERGPFHFVGGLGCKIKVRFRFLFGLPKTPTKPEGKKRGTERRGALGHLGSKFQVATKFSYCEPFLTTYNFNNFSS